MSVLGEEQGQGQRLFPLCAACWGRAGVTHIAPILSVWSRSLRTGAILEEGVGACMLQGKEEGLSLLENL